jgi:hypothetical protein
MSGKIGRPKQRRIRRLFSFNPENASENLFRALSGFNPADFPARQCSISTQWQVQTTAATGRPGLRQGATRKSFDPVAELVDLG